jgi:protein TonB
MVLHRFQIIRKIRQTDIFKLCLSISILFHSAVCGAYLISTLPSNNDGTIYDAKNFKASNADVDFIDIPPAELFGGSSNPAPVEKKEWIEGAGKNAPDADNSDLNINRISGTGTDPDGYLSSDLGDHPPIPMIDFDLNRFFPPEAKSANIRRKTVILHMQIDEDGSIKSAKISSPPSGYGFDQAVMKVIHKIRFKPGRVDGKSVKMFMRLPITFVLED